MIKISLFVCLCPFRYLDIIGIWETQCVSINVMNDLLDVLINTVCVCDVCDVCNAIAMKWSLVLKARLKG